jgi:hypothetical protein
MMVAALLPPLLPSPSPSPLLLLLLLLPHASPHSGVHCCIGSASTEAERRAILSQASHHAWAQASDLIVTTLVRVGCPDTALVCACVRAYAARCAAPAALRGRRS